MMTTATRSGAATRGRTPTRPPLVSAALDLLDLAHRGLATAAATTVPAERYAAAHLAALRAAAAVLAVRGRPTGRRAPRTVWDMLAAVAPEVAAWATYFAAGAPLRRAVEAGRVDAVDAEHAERTLCAAEDFLDEVRALLDPGTAARPVERPLHAVRAS
jgi:SAV_6107-like HEPN